MDADRWNRLNQVARRRTELRGERQAIVGTEGSDGGTWWCIVPAARKGQTKKNAAHCGGERDGQEGVEGDHEAA